MSLATPKKYCIFLLHGWKSKLRRNAMVNCPRISKKNQNFLNWWNEAESQLQNFKWNRNFQNSVAKYDGESPSKIETKTNILQILKQWHILLSHHQQICKILCKISPLGTEIGEKWAVNEENLIKLAISYLQIGIYWNHSRQSATSIPSLFSPLYSKSIL